MKLRYNAPVVLTFSLLCAAELLAMTLTGGPDHSPLMTMFSISPIDFSFGSLTSWLRLFTHTIGHLNWEHLIGNLSFILLIGPILEEKYGSLPVLLVMLVTALATGIIDILIVRSALLGASGIVFALILLSSFTNIRSGEIPITFILIVILFLVKELWYTIAPQQSAGPGVANFAHVLGGVVGAAFGFVFAKAEKPKSPPTPKKPTLEDIERKIGGNLT
jgi:membrane associated rhomboid family serine protease